VFDLVEPVRPCRRLVGRAREARLAEVREGDATQPKESRTVFVAKAVEAALKRREKRKHKP
jgi:hypothetical protein